MPRQPLNDLFKVNDEYFSKTDVFNTMNGQLIPCKKHFDKTNTLFGLRFIEDDGAWDLYSWEPFAGNWGLEEANVKVTD